MPPAADAPAATTPRPVPAIAIAGLLVVTFLSAIDATIVSTAMPRVIETIGGMGLYPWAFTGFLLTSTLATPVFGHFADRVGLRRCMFFAIGLFLAGSALCGAAPSMPWLVAFRALQGLGAGGAICLTYTAFGVIFAPAERGKAQGLLSLVWGVSSLLGPLGGGLMVTHFPWPWIFWVNLPVGLMATAMIARGLPRSAETHGAHPLDWWGAALLGGALFGLMLASTAHGPLAWAVTGAALAAALAFAHRQTRSLAPLVPTEPFRDRTIAVSTALSFGTCVSMFAALNYMPLYVQGVLGRSAPEAGAALTPMNIAWPVAAAIAGAAINRVGFRPLSLAGTALMAAAFGLLVCPGTHEALWAVASDGVLLGAGMGLVNAATMVAVQAAAPRRMIGRVSATISLARNVGSTLGIAVLGGLQLRVLAHSAIARGLPAAPASAEAALGRSTGPFQQALGTSLEAVFGASLVVALACLALAFWMPDLTPERAATGTAAREAERAPGPSA